jgi:BASS family bile acid:Na+ symporter
MLQRFLIVWLSLTAWIAWSWPRWASTGLDPFLWLNSRLAWLIAITMFAIGCLLPRDELRQVLSRWPQVLGGTAVQYTVMPLLGFACAWLFGLEGPERIGVIIVGCVPGAMASNIMTLAARGNVSYSVSLTTSATMVSPLVVPLGLYLALGREVRFPVQNVAVSLVMTVVVPVLTGYTLCQIFPRWQSPARRWSPVVANLAVIFIIAAVVASNRERLGTALDPRLLGTLLTINLLGYALGYFGGFVIGIDEPMRRALAIEVGMQNAGLGAFLASTLFSPSAALPCTLYAFGCLITGALLAQFWAWRAPETKAPPGEPPDGTNLGPTANKVPLPLR